MTILQKLNLTFNILFICGFCELSLDQKQQNIIIKSKMYRVWYTRLMPSIINAAVLLVDIKVAQYRSTYYSVTAILVDNSLTITMIFLFYMISIVCIFKSKYHCTFLQKMHKFDDNLCIILPNCQPIDSKNFFQKIYAELFAYAATTWISYFMFNYVVGAFSNIWNILRALLFMFVYVGFGILMLQIKCYAQMLSTRFDVVLVGISTSLKCKDNPNVYKIKDVSNLNKLIEMLEYLWKLKSVFGKTFGSVIIWILSFVFAINIVSFFILIFYAQFRGMWSNDVFIWFIIAFVAPSCGPCVRLLIALDHLGHAVSTIYL